MPLVLPHALAALKPAAFPIYPPKFTTQNPDGSQGGAVCSCGLNPCPTKPGKHPAIRWGELGEHEQKPIPPGWNVGLCTGKRSGFFVVDLDVRDDVNGVENWEALGDAPATLLLGTGGGYQLVYKWPGFDVRNSAGELAPGVDIRGDGGMIVAPGSVHASGEKYEVVEDLPIADAPEWLLSWAGLKKTDREVSDAAEGGNAPTTVRLDSPEGVRRVAMAREYLEATAEPSVQGQNGSAALWAVALHVVRKLELPLATCLDLIEELYNPRCEPAWSRGEILHKLEDARDRSDLPCGVAPEGWSLIKKPEMRPVDKTRKKHDPKHVYTHVTGRTAPMTERSKVPLSNLINTLLTHPDWDGVLQWDEFRKQAIAVDPPLRMDMETTGLSETDCTGVTTWFEAKGVNTTERVVAMALKAAARERPFHPVKEWLQSLRRPDHIRPNARPMISIMAEKVFGTTEPLHQVFIEKFLVAAVRRILTPGYKWDNMLVLQGDQGSYKSTFVAALFGPEFVRTQMPELTGRDASHALEGYWAIELGEMDKILRAETSTVKDFLSRQVDTYRAFGTGEKVTVPRSCVFIGTTNEDDFLRDATGDRRYWPIAIPRGAKINIGWVRQHRDTVWREAYERAIDPKYDCELTPDEFRDAMAHRAFFRQTDPFHAETLDYCSGRTWVKSSDVYDIVLAKGNDSIISNRKNSKEMRRVTDTLKRIGAWKSTVRIDGWPTSVWFLPDEVRDAKPSAKEVKRRAAEEVVGRLQGIASKPS